MFEKKHVMSMSTLELEREILETQKNVDKLEKQKKYKTRAILTIIAIIAILAMIF